MNIFDNFTTNTLTVPTGFRLLAIAPFFHRKEPEKYLAKLERGLDIVLSESFPSDYNTCLCSALN